LYKIISAISVWLCCHSAFAKNASEAVSDMQAVSDTDPNGFKWMVVCIGLLFVIATSLIVATVVYGMKSKK
jgi:hypothetical protein